MSTHSQPWLTVILPTYQGEAYVEAALQGIAAQHDPNVEVMVIDDGSTDGTRALLEAWRDKLHLTIHHNERHGNWVRSTNQGLALARGMWVSLLHQDDLWMPDRLTVLRGLMQQQPSVDLFLHPADFIDEQERRVGCWKCSLPAARALTPADVLPRLAVQNFVPIVSPLFRRALAERVGPMDEDLWYFADWDYWLRLAGAGTSWYHSQPLACFRLHEESQTAQRTRDWQDVGRQFDIVQQRVLAQEGFPESRIDAARRMSDFARVTYLWLLSGTHGMPTAGTREWLRAALRVGPVGWWRYMRDSRLWDRISPRLRLRLRSCFRRRAT